MLPRAMVLCAGLGTRLRPLTLELPKPLIPVGDRPLLGHIVARLVAAGFDEIVLNTHHLPDAFSSFQESLAAKLHRIHEPVILGTAGGVAGARELFGAPPIVLWNGDILADPPLGELCAAAATGGLALAIAVRSAGEGTVGLTHDGDVARLRGERFADEALGGDYVGVAALGARCLAALPEQGCLIGDWALPELRAGRAIHTVRVEGGFSDAGDLAVYLQLNLDWLRRSGASVFVGVGATVSSTARLDACVIGAGARVEGEGEVRRVVAWPGALVRAPLHDAIVSRSGRVVHVDRAGDHSR